MTTLRSKLNRLGYALDARGPAFIFVVDARADSPTYGERLAGAFGNEAGAERWIDAIVASHIEEDHANANRLAKARCASCGRFAFHREDCATPDEVAYLTGGK